MADYTYKFNLFGLPPVDMDVLIANSTTMMVGDPVHFEDGDVADRGAATEPLGGFCVGIVSKNGIPLELVKARRGQDNMLRQPTIKPINK